jgi:hypothetical protein
MQQLRWLKSDILQWRAVFNPRSVFVGFVVVKVEMGQDFLLVFPFLLASNISLILHIHLPVTNTT